MSDCSCGRDELSPNEVAAEAERQESYRRVVENASVRATSTVLTSEEARKIIRRERLAREYFGVSVATLKAVLGELVVIKRADRG